MATKALPDGDAKIAIVLVLAALGSARGLLHEVLRHMPALNQRVARLHDRGGTVAVEVSVAADGKHAVLVTGIEPNGERTLLSRVATTRPLPNAGSARGSGGIGRGLTTSGSIEESD
jgi:hypothetical protein